MPDSNSPRHKLPYLVVAQSQKELTHNEALAKIDALLHPVVQSMLSSPPVVSMTDAGKCWLVGAAASSDWVGKTNQLAVLGGGSWLFLEPVTGMRLRNIATNTDYVWSGTQWVAAPSVTDPQSGSVIDVEARAAIAALLSHFRAIGQFTA
jgi:Protein of unknown function (DUF2793)